MMTKTIAFKTKPASVKQVPLPEALVSIDALTAKYADDYGQLYAEMVALNQKIEAAKKAHIDTLRRLVETTKASKAALSDAIIANADAFTQPRTRQLHGFKVGLRKGKGELVFANEQKAIELIQKHFPESFDVLVETRYSIVKNAAGQLTAAELKRIGGEVIDSDDEVVIKSATGDVEKLVDALIREKADA